MLAGRTAPSLLCLALSLFSLPMNAQTGAPVIHGIAIADMDPTIKPGADFYRYADGAWLKRTEIPADRPGFGVFTMLDVLSSKRTAEVVENASKAKAAAGTDERKIADMYHSYMDEASIESNGLAALRPHLDAIAAIKSQPELAFALGKTLRADVDALNNTNFHTANLFGLWVAPGFNDPDHYAPYLMEGGVQLPDREFYLGTSERMEGIRKSYQTHVTTMLKLAGFKDAEDRAARIVALERAIAEKHRSLADNENIEHANNPWKRTDFPTKAPGLNWNEYFRGAGLDKLDTFIVWQPEAFTGESALVPVTPLDTWKDWLAFHLIEQYAGALPKAFADERFAFFGKTLTGTMQMRPRDQRAIQAVNGTLGDAVGKLYAKRFFSPEEKAQVQAMVANIMASFRRRIDGLTWMAPATKAEAQAKLNTLNVGVGYPDTWRDYTGLEIKPADFFGNVLRSSLFDYHYNLSRLGQAVDRKEWCMEPQTVNAVNLPLHNGLNFPAAILQPPFFDPKAPAASNYGAIGTIMGHEISHTFDSEGAAFDSKGRVRNWWTPSDLAHFKASTAALAAQYDTYKPFSDIHVNGTQTLGENIADVAGAAAALDGFHASLHGKPAPLQDGFTGDQQFFIAFAQNYRNVSREAALRQQVMTDPHSPSQYRATTVRNLDAWYDAFKVQPGDALYLAPDARVRIW